MLRKEPPCDGSPIHLMSYGAIQLFPNLRIQMNFIAGQVDCLMVNMEAHARMLVQVGR